MSKCKLCNVALEPLDYYYDDDWGHKGNKVFDYDGNEKILYHCPECGLIYALEKNK